MKKKLVSAIAILNIILIAGPFTGEARPPKHDKAKIAFTFPTKGHAILELSELSTNMQKSLLRVADHYTLYMVVESSLSRGDLVLYEYLSDRLPLSSFLLRELKLARYNIYEDDPGSYRWIDPEGVYSRFKLIYKEPGKRIYFGSGYYAGRLTPRIDGSAIIVFLYRQVTVGDKSYMQSEIYGYIQVDNILFSTLAKVLRPILPLVVRKRMGNLINVTRTLSEWIAEDPTEVYHLLARSKHITPRELADFKQRFVVKKK